MAYIIYNNDGTVLTTIPEGDVDADTTGLTLVGKNLNNYGEYINQNFVKLLNNFASTTEPPSPQTGQLWFNKVINRLTVYDGASFKPTYGATVATTSPISTSTGDLWYDTINSQLKIWNGTNFKLVGPAVPAQLGKFGVEPPIDAIVDETSGDDATVSLLFSHGTAAAFIVPPSTSSSNAFVLSDADAVSYLEVSGPLYINEGITLFNNLDMYGDFRIRGQYQVPSVSVLSANADITAFGDPAGSDLVPYNTSTVQSRIGTANVFICEEILPKLFSTTTNYSSYAFPPGSDAKVVCYYNTSISVRRYLLSAIDGISKWIPYDLYSTSFGTVSTLTNIVI